MHGPNKRSKKGEVHTGYYKRWHANSFNRFGFSAKDVEEYIIRRGLHYIREKNKDLTDITDYRFDSERDFFSIGNKKRKDDPFDVGKHQKDSHDGDEDEYSFDSEHPRKKPGKRPDPSKVTRYKTKRSDKQDAEADAEETLSHKKPIEIEEASTDAVELPGLLALEMYLANRFAIGGYNPSGGVTFDTSNYTLLDGFLTSGGRTSVVEQESQVRRHSWVASHDEAHYRDLTKRMSGEYSLTDTQQALIESMNRDKNNEEAVENANSYRFVPS